MLDSTDADIASTDLDIVLAVPPSNCVPFDVTPGGGVADTLGCVISP
jgi:hypothetical protein